ncbi:MAG: helix-turn-helix transcriptional regulator [Finegoldia magna]|uniref:helix-turn-helix transcriptional regulator n=1 Tax=Finegoldia magna TaxID=1260 RepID=UPI00290A29C4|nr:helix-turn-helix transcriptional regulator [Finegoldia magna]MDU7891447.1 helix-turn-helix transcriptional regulator [Finegoldia magna]
MLGLSQHRLGKKVGISRTSINKIETGKTILSFKTANDIANALGVCMYKIFDLEEETYKCHSHNSY